MKKRPVRRIASPVTLLAFIFGSIVIGSTGTIATTPSIPTWYAGLIKPSFNPPNWIFGPVWTLLFILMGIAAYMIFEAGWNKPKVKYAFTAFILQFILNVVWSFAFFGMQSPLLGLLVIAGLWFLILLTIIRFYQVKPNAAYLLIPYIAWVSFAAILNTAIFILNG